jgi:hypothetical protein
VAQQRELLQEFKSWLAQAIHDDKLFQETVTWDAGLMGLPNQQGGIVPIIGVYMAIPSMILGEQVVTWNMLPANAPIDEDVVREFVRQAFEALQQARSQKADEALTLGTPQGASSGLVLPGQ